jgi:hypothetical protein
LQRSGYRLGVVALSRREQLGGLVELLARDLPRDRVFPRMTRGFARGKEKRASLAESEIHR